MKSNRVEKDKRPSIPANTKRLINSLLEIKCNVTNRSYELQSVGHKTRQKRRYLLVAKNEAATRKCDLVSESKLLISSLLFLFDRIHEYKWNQYLNVEVHVQRQNIFSSPRPSKIRSKYTLREILPEQNSDRIEYMLFKTKTWW